MVGNSSNNNNRGLGERPLKCGLCPTSTASDALKKRGRRDAAVASSSGAESIDDDASPTPQPLSSSTHSAAAAQDAGDLPFKCHLCDEGKCSLILSLERAHRCHIYQKSKSEEWREIGRCNRNLKYIEAKRAFFLATLTTVFVPFCCC